MSKSAKRERTDDLSGCGITDNRFSRFIMDLSRILRDMEKEHSVKDQSAPTDNHIVAVPAL